MTVSELNVLDDLKLKFKKKFHDEKKQSLTLEEIIQLFMTFIEERTQNNDH